MKIYNSGSYGRGTTIVSPGAHQPENSAWVDPHTKRPLQFVVKFENGEADVDDGLGRYLIDQGLAKRSRIAVPPPPDFSMRPRYAKPIEVGRPLANPGVA